MDFFTFYLLQILWFGVKLTRLSVFNVYVPCKLTKSKPANWKPVLPEVLLRMLSVLRIDFKRERESKCDTQKTRKRRGTKTAQEWENEKKN